MKTQSVEEPEDKNAIKKLFNEAIKSVEDMGGWVGAKTGNWLFPLIHKTFEAYFNNADPEYFRSKYPKATDEQIIKKLINLAAANAGILGGIVGASISVDEILAVFATLPTGGTNLPVQMGVAGVVLSAEAIVLCRIQLKLIANIARILSIPIDPNDPEDMLKILLCVSGGVGIQGIGSFAAKAGGKATEKIIRKKIGKETLKALQKAAAKFGQNLLQRNIIKYFVPLASIGIGSTWNYLATKTVGKIALKHLTEHKEERRPDPVSKLKRPVIKKAPKKALLKKPSSKKKVTRRKPKSE